MAAIGLATWAVTGFACGVGENQTDEVHDAVCGGASRSVWGTGSAIVAFGAGLVMRGRGVTMVFGAAGVVLIASAWIGVLAA